MMELTILKKQLPEIDINFEEVKAQLEENLKAYETLVVTEENLKDSKKTQRDLAGLKKKVDTYRKDIKKEMSEPIKLFEDKCKELVGIIEDTEKPIKAGIEVFNDKIKTKKLGYTEGKILYLSEKFNLEKELFEIKDSFLNLTTTKKHIDEELAFQCDNLVKKKEAIEKNKELLHQQIATLNNSFALESILTFDEISNKITDENYMELSQELLKEATRRKETQDRIKNQLEEKKQEELKKLQEETEKAIEQQKEVVKEKIIEKVDFETGEIIEEKSIVLRITADDDKFRLLAKFLKKNEIKFEKLGDKL